MCAPGICAHGPKAEELAHFCLCVLQRVMWRAGASAQAYPA